LLLTDFLDDMLNSTPNILQTDKDLHLNMDRIKETPLEDLAKEDKVALVLVLLKQLQPYLSVNNLSMATMQNQNNLHNQHHLPLIQQPMMPNQSRTTRAADLPSYNPMRGGGARDNSIRKSHGQGITSVYHPP